MNGEEFYNLFKQALDKLGAGFRDKQSVVITGVITMSVAEGKILHEISIMANDKKAL